MRAVNLIPADAKRGGGGSNSAPRGPGIALLVLLGVALVFVTIYVLTTNTINDRRAKLTTVQGQVALARAQAARLANYSQFAKLAESRAATVQQIASQRFDWHQALSDLSRVVPSNTSLQSLLGTVSPTASVAGAGGSVSGSAAAAGGALRGAIPSPAFELKGCTATQDDVARLMSRLRLIDGVTRVTLANSIKQDSAEGGATVTSAAGGASQSGTCGANTPSFDLVVFFGPLPGATTAALAPGASPTPGPAPATPGQAPATQTPAPTVQTGASTSAASQPTGAPATPATSSTSSTPATPTTPTTPRTQAPSQPVSTSGAAR